MSVNSQNLLHFWYKVSDLNTGVAYIGIAQIGKCKKSSNMSEDHLKRIVTENIESVNILQTSRVYLICMMKQNLSNLGEIEPRRSSFKIDLSRNLGVPRYLLNSCILQLNDYKILVSDEADIDVIN